MKFSVLIPVYNCEKYICDAVNSVFEQTYKDFEIVLVDDGSVDKSAELCDKLAEKYPDKIKVIHQKNSGQLISRCNAIKASSGDYCLFLDADDIYLHGTLEKLNELITEYNSPDMIVFSFYYNRNGVLEKSKTIVDDTVLYEGELLKKIHTEFLYGILLNSVCLKAVRRDIAVSSIDDFSAYKQLRCSEDRFQSLKMLVNSKRIVYTNTPLYQYRLFEGSTTRAYSCETISRFNNKVLYSEEKNLLKIWNMDDSEFEEKLVSKWADYPLYVMDLFYFNVKRSDRKSVIRYKWADFLPNEIDENRINNNSYINLKKKKLWNMIFREKYFSIRLHFIKKNLYKTLRAFKRRLIK